MKKETENPLMIESNDDQFENNFHSVKKNRKRKNYFLIDDSNESQSEEEKKDDEYFLRDHENGNPQSTDEEKDEFYIQKKKLSGKKKNVKNVENQKYKKIDFSFSFEELGSSYNNFANFKNYLLNNHKNVKINDQFLQTEILVESTNKYIEYLRDRKNITMTSKNNYLRFLKIFFKKISENEKISLEKKYLKLSIQKIEEAMSKTDKTKKNF